MLSRRLIYVGTALGMAFIPNASFASEPLQPARPWVLNYGESECSAWREYGAAGRSMTLLVRPTPDAQTYDLQLILRRAAGPFVEMIRGSLDFGNGPIVLPVLRYQDVADKLQIHRFRISAAQMAQARSARSITIERGDYQAPVRLSLQSMPDLLNRLDQCNADLRRYWNIGAKLSERAHGDLRTIFTSDDYPVLRVGGTGQGVAQFLLFVDENGKVAACHVLRPSGVPTLDAMGCIVFKQRARLSPARDLSGKPARDAIVTQPIVWRARGAEH